MPDPPSLEKKRHMVPRKQIFSHFNTIPATNVKNVNLCPENKVMREEQILNKEVKS
jgi:hypothetical protein